MKFLKKNRALKIIAIITVALFIISVAQDQILKQALIINARSITGTKVGVGGFSLSLLRQKIRITNLSMKNPKGFPAGTLLDIPKFYVDANMLGLAQGKIDIERADVEIRQILLVKNKQGQLNVDELRFAKEKKPVDKRKPEKETGFKIHLLNLKMGKLILEDYSASEKPLIRVYDINLQKGYKDINSSHQLVALIIAEPMKAAGIRSAKIYGLSAFTGVGMLPVTAALTLTGKDFARAEFNHDYQIIFEQSLKVIKQMGNLKSQDKENGFISAIVQGSDVTIKIKRLTSGSNEVTVSARKYLLPKPEIAGGVLYQITEQLK